MTHIFNEYARYNHISNKIDNIAEGQDPKNLKNDVVFFSSSNLAKS